MFKETTLACLFDVGSLIAGFVIALQLGVFQLSPWAIASVPSSYQRKSRYHGIAYWTLEYGAAFRHCLSQVFWQHKKLLQTHRSHGCFNFGNQRYNQHYLHSVSESCFGESQSPISQPS